MALKQNIIYVYFKGKHQVTSKSQYQYNHGQFLYFADLDLPQAFEVHFSNRDKGESKTQIGSNKLVEIPDEYFWNGALQIYAWIYLHNQANDGETVYEVRIPLIKRAKPTDEEPLPVQQSAIDKAIAELATAVDITNENANKTNSDKTVVANIKDEVVILKENIDSTAITINQKAQETINASERAETSAQNAATSERKALDYVQQAEQSAQSALESKNIANQKAEIATDAATETLGYRNESLEAKDQAVQAKKNIVDYRDETKGYRDETSNLKNDVQTLKGQIEDISNTVGENAQSASQSASSASQSASSANQSASNASRSASQAEQFKNQSETNVTHYPKVVDGYWYVWDASVGEYVNTNVDARGIKGDDGESGVYIGTEEPTDENVDVWIDSDGTVDDIVTDVQINGQSIVSDGVANVPISATGVLGVVKPSYGIKVSDDGTITTDRAPTNYIKGGGNSYNPIVPDNQHVSTFYGLAKAAGDTTQSQSSNAVGQYTDTAKGKIHDMLGIGIAKEIRAYSELGEDMDLIEIPLPDRYEKVWFRFMCRINNAENNLTDAVTPMAAWLGDSANVIFQQTFVVYENAYIRQSNTFMIKGWFIVDFPFVDTFSSGPYGATNWSTKSGVNSVDGSYKYVNASYEKLTSYPRFLFIRPYETSKGYLFKANSWLGVYAK